MPRPQPGIVHGLNGAQQHIVIVRPNRAYVVKTGVLSGAAIAWRPPSRVNDPPSECTIRIFGNCEINARKPL
jgi:hypothetical protein